MNTIESAVQLPARIDTWWEKEIKKPAAVAVKEKMQASYAFFKENGFPHTKLEDWKYTRVQKVTDFPYALPAEQDSHINPDTFHALPLADIEDAYRFVFVNGYLQKELSLLPDEAHKFTVTHLGEESGKDHYEEHLASVVNNDTGFTALNTALHSDGILIHIPEGLVVDKPVMIYYVALTDNDLYFIQPRNIVVAEANSEVQFAEIFVGKGAEISLTNVVTEIRVGEGAHLDYSRLQLENDQNFHIGYTGITQQKNSRIDTHVISLGGGFVRNNLHFDLQGENCTSIMNGLYMLKDEQFLDNHTRVDHAVPHCLSDQLYKGILAGNSTGVFNGKIVVHQDAQKTNAYQRNVNVLLSEGATINTKPQLEIFADDVRCTHGATAGFIDEEAIFYLRSRGIGEEDARNMLMNAFANEVVDKMNVESVKDSLRKAILRKLQ